MNDLINLQAQQIQALQTELAKTRQMLSDAKELLQNVLNDWEVVGAEVIDFPYLDEPTKLFDEAFNNPIEQLNNLIP